MNSMIDVQKITVSRIFEITPEPYGNYLYLGIIFAIIFALGVFFKLFKTQRKLDQKVYNAYGNLGLYLGITGLTIIFMRWQSIPYLGSRFILLVAMLIGLLWFGNIVFYKLVIIPKKLLLKKAKENFEKYLPRRAKN